MSFSLIASITRSAGHRDVRVAEAERENMTARLAREAYEIAVADRRAECASGRGPKCRGKWKPVEPAREALVWLPRSALPIPQRNAFAALLGIGEPTVTLYSPLLCHWH